MIRWQGKMACDEFMKYFIFVVVIWERNIDGAKLIASFLLPQKNRAASDEGEKVE